jgi:site-specific recombinase XerD
MSSGYQKHPPRTAVYGKIPVMDETLLASWELAMRAERKAPKTIALYTASVRAYLRWCEETVAPATVSKPAAQAWIADLLEAGAEPATAYARLKSLRQFSKWLAAEGEIDADPLLGMANPKLDRKIVQALDDDQLRALIKACSGTSLVDRRDEAIVRLMIDTGARAGEVSGLQVADVDLARGLVTITRGKGGKGRTVPISAQTGLALDRYLRLARREGRISAEFSALWVGAHRGKTFGYDGLARMLKARAETAQIAHFHAHLLRHTFATRWKAARGSDDGLMAVAGWSSRAMIDRYAGAAAASRAADEARALGLGDL